MKELKTTFKLKKALIFISFALLTFSTSSCNEDGDITSPKVEISSPGEGDSFTVDDTIEVVGRATDEVALQTLNISSNLGINEDITSFEDPSDFPFNIALTLDPATTAGEYTISFLATDTSGNTGEAVVNIEIQ